MQIIVNTKYNIDDTVYMADCYNDYHVPGAQYIVNNIIIKTDSKAYVVYYNCIEQATGIICRIPESWLFKTYDECKQWCNKQNIEWGW